ncbi:acetyl-CoA carboxylase, carboxyltransferase subunit beta [Pseudonocardia sp. ICBG1142]|uniref:acetyl-CoA carboxylase, carboxyltransferase subunit beta n=1 Tax=Pseudonocardia sp. ICBG1142 TaxID=2846760 RepID=UPI001CF63CD3|nr:acetyl-CoA carboxylase, carboxyltransferase subunit beta [Pseudonocardia sp. ICBG1142]
MTETLPAPPLPTPAAGPTDWVLCTACDAMVYAKRLRRGAGVCPECGHHGPLTAPERLAGLLDEGSVRLLPIEHVDGDPLGFVDSRPYPDRLRDARRRTGLQEAVLCARGRIDGHPVVVAAMDFGFLGGSLGAAVGEAITRACEVAEAEHTPLLLVSASGGARMQEGVVALMQMAKTSQALRRLDEAGVLTISLVTDPTYGGVAASFATLCDVIVAEPGARLGFAGPRVIAQTIGETLPEGFQTAEYLLEHGIVDLIVPRAELRGALSRLLAVAGGQACLTDESPEVVVRDPAALPERHPWDAVRAARRFGRPTTLDYAHLLLEDFTELHGDRMAADCAAMVCGLGRLAGTPVVLVGTQKGRTPGELARRNYGMPTPAGYRKAARVLRLAGKLGLPVVSLVDTSGAFPGVAAEEQGQAVAIAENLRLLSGLPVPVVAVVTGEGGSGGALALAVADVVLMCADAVYSVITPEGCASILWKDAGCAPRAAEALRVDARSLLGLGVVDGVVPETEHGDHLAAAEALGAALLTSLLPLSRMDSASRIERRHARFRAFGAPTPGANP